MYIVMLSNLICVTMATNVVREVFGLASLNRSCEIYNERQAAGIEKRIERTAKEIEQTTKSLSQVREQLKSLSTNTDSDMIKRLNDEEKELARNLSRLQESMTQYLKSKKQVAPKIRIGPP